MLDNSFNLTPQNVQKVWMKMESVGKKEPSGRYTNCWAIHITLDNYIRRGYSGLVCQLQTSHLHPLYSIFSWLSQAESVTATAS